MATRLATATRNAAADALADRADVGTIAANGRLRFYAGEQPASANDMPTGDLLAEVDLGNPAFGAAAAGTVALLGVPLSTVGLPAAGAGTVAGWFRVVDRDAATVFDGAVGAEGSGAELEVNTTTISENVIVEVLSGTVTLPSGE